MSNKTVSNARQAFDLQDHSACGLGFVASEDGIPSNEIVRLALEGLANMEHRGGIASDEDLEDDGLRATSDGAGITLQVDQNWWKDRIIRQYGTNKLRKKGKYTALGERDIAVGTFFLPRDNYDHHEKCRQIIRREFEKFGYEVRDRKTPMEDLFLGELAKETQPRIWDYGVINTAGVSDKKFDLDVYRIRKRIEKKVKQAQQKKGWDSSGQNRFEIVSLSRHYVTRKGLSQAHRLEDLFTDLKYSKNLLIKKKGVIEDRNYKSSYAVFHRRYATNTLPTWPRAHPYHSGVAHNGEINSLVTNVEMFKQRLEQVFIELYAAEYAKASGELTPTELQELKEDLKDVINLEGTDSAMLGDVVDFLRHAGFSPPAIKALLVPEAIIPGSEMSDDMRNVAEFVDALLGPWDGPNTMIAVGDNELVIGGDRSGFRPIRIVRTKNKIIYGASEIGIIHSIPNKDLIESIDIDPGQMMVVSAKERRIIRDKEVKERNAKELSEKLGTTELLKNLVHVDTVPAGEQDYKWTGSESEQELRLRQRLGHHSRETIEYLYDMARDGKEPLGSMGDDAALAVVPNLDGKTIHRSIQNFFQQKFAQVTNPPLDTIREKVVTSLKTYLGFFYDKDGKKTSKKVHALDSPILTNASFQALRDKLGEHNIHEIKCTFDVNGDNDQFKTVLDLICSEAEVMARHGRHIVLTDEHIGKDRVAIPMLMAAGAVNTHLAKLGLRGQTTINVRTSEAFEPHDFATLIGLGGADTVNAYLAEETLAADYRLKVCTFKDETSSFDSKTTLRKFMEVYAKTGDAELDQKKTELLHKAMEKPGMSAFAGAHADLTLEDLAKHSSETVRRTFKSLMKGLNIEVKDIFGKNSLDHAISNWVKASENGLLKIMGKMGISHINSYRGGRLFEALGLSQEIIDMCFPGVSTPIKGLSLLQVQECCMEHQKQIYDNPKNFLPHSGRYKYRSGADTVKHILRSEDIERFQKAIKGDHSPEGYKKFRKYLDELNNHTEKYRFGPIHWLGFKKGQKPVDISEVEGVMDIVKRFHTGSMSRGSISQEAHELLALVMNELGGKSQSGEGGEDPKRYGTNKRSKSKQVASGRFGVTARYLLDADEIQIKMAQGAKPGEGGELKPEKVTLEIATLRHCEPGTPLISPSTHHDIYSIEDLEQLIYDIKQLNPRAKVNVKLVASNGVDVIASGCAKANADTVHVSGYNGGTGASPQGSIVHAGMPWELFLNKVQQTLGLQNFRERVRLSTDGGMRSGRDIVIAALMGAEDYGYGLMALVAEGCVLARSCQNGKCPVKVAGDEGKFIGTPEMVKNMMLYIAEDVREILASLGLKSLDEAIGRTDLLEQVWGQHLGLDISDAIRPPAEGQKPQKCEAKKRNDRVNPKKPKGKTLDQRILQKHKKAMMEAIRTGGRFETKVWEINNEDRTFGARITGILLQEMIDDPALGRDARIKEESVILNLKGIAGQSLGFALAEGLTINLEGAANDGVGKALSGGTICVSPDRESYIHEHSNENVIIGNAALYGATSGNLYAAGQAGNRFAIRNSGAEAVVEGAGYAACNYMTAGSVVILGKVGQNFGSGMSGGEAFVYDEDESLMWRIQDSDTRKKTKSIRDTATQQRLKERVTEHFNKTGSLHAKRLLEDWSNSVKKFKQIKGKASNTAPAPLYKSGDDAGNPALAAA